MLRTAPSIVNYGLDILFEGQKTAIQAPVITGNLLGKIVDSTFQKMLNSHVFL